MTSFKIDETKITHSIKTVVINEDNSKVFRIDNTDPNAPFLDDVTLNLAYNIEVSSINGVYVLDFKDSSTGFKVDDIIRIEGKDLTGVDGQNELEIKIETVVTVPDGDKIQTIDETADIHTARHPPVSKFKITQKINVDDYFVEHVSGIGFQIGDILKIDGVGIGGTSSTNDLEIIVDSLDNATGLINLTNLTGKSDCDSGSVGQIKSVTISGNSKEDIADGSWVFADTTSSGNAVNINNIATPDLEIGLLNKLDKGIKNIENDISISYADIIVAKGNLVTSKEIFLLDLSNQLDKLKCINCSLVLYDEIPSYNEVSKDTLSANTYSRLNGCAFKRI